MSKLVPCCTGTHGACWKGLPTVDRCKSPSPSIHWYRAEPHLIGRSETKTALTSVIVNLHALKAGLRCFSPLLLTIRHVPAAQNSNVLLKRLPQRGVIDVQPLFLTIGLSAQPHSRRRCGLSQASPALQPWAHGRVFKPMSQVAGHQHCVHCHLSKSLPRQTK